MSTGNQNLDLLIKLLGQTQSDNENIAIMAMRKANEQVTKFKTTWEDLLTGRVTVVADPFSGGSPIIDRAKAPPPPSGGMARGNPASAPPPPPRQATTPQKPQPISYCHDCGLSLHVGQAHVYQGHDYCYHCHKKATTAPDPNAGGAQFKPNKHPANCYKCNIRLAAGEGVLNGKNYSGHWRVECAPGKGHNQTSAAVKPKGRRSTVDIMNDLNKTPF